MGAALSPCQSRLILCSLEVTPDGAQENRLDLLRNFLLPQVMDSPPKCGDIFVESIDRHGHARQACAIFA